MARACTCAHVHDAAIWRGLTPPPIVLEARRTPAVEVSWLLWDRSRKVRDTRLDRAVRARLAQLWAVKACRLRRQGATWQTHRC